MTRPLLVLALLALTLPISAQTAEYRVKAAFLLNFIHFVDWPSGAFAGPEAPLGICVVGADPFGDALEQMVEGEATNGRKIVARRVSAPADAESCQLVFISRSEEQRLEPVLAALGDGPVLTVSDIDGFVPRGGTIGFFLDRSRVRFEIGLSEARRRRLKLSSQLLSLGRIVQ